MLSQTALQPGMAMSRVGVESYTHSPTSLPLSATGAWLYGKPALATRTGANYTDSRKARREL